MFAIGEFARLAQVSTRLLRYYDQLGLLKPVHIDKFTNYRYYSAEQLPDLNRILALKELGLSLEQIQQVLNDNISTDELQGMLLLKKSEIEQQLEAELQRIRNIESRLQSIRNSEAGKPLDVIIKQVPPQAVLSLRMAYESTEMAMGIFWQIMSALPAPLPTTNTPNNPYDWYFGIWYSGGLYEQGGIEIEMGRQVNLPTHPSIPLNGDLQLTYRQLPAVPTMATFVVKGPTEAMHIGYSAIGTWVEVNKYRFAGEPREIFLRLPEAADLSDGITEIQYPIEAIA